MTEKVQNEGIDVPGENKPQELTPIEQRAKELGWRPKEEFHGDEDDFIDAKEFVRRQPLFEKIEGQSKEIKRINKSLEALKAHYTAVRETEYKRALAALEEQRTAAVSEADGATFSKVDAQIKQVEREFAEIKQDEARQAPQNDPAEFVSWKAKNEWYDKDETMRVFADAYGVKLAGKGLPPAEVLDSVAKKVREAFPQKFRNPNKNEAPDVGVSSASGRSSGKESFELSDMERSIMNTLVRDGTMTKEQYIADLKKIKNR